MSSKLAKIDVLPNQLPLDLLKAWISDFRRNSPPVPLLFNLATASKQGDVKNRFVVLKNLSDDGLVFNTNCNGPKVRHIAENPNVAACFAFVYREGNARNMSRQVRIEGTAQQISDKIDEGAFNSSPLYVKMRDLLIPEQSVEVQWDDLKRKHDEILDKVKKNELELKPTGNTIEYIIVPKTFDFYEASDEEIADRVLFKCDSGKWTHCHITA